MTLSYIRVYDVIWGSLGERISTGDIGSVLDFFFNGDRELVLGRGCGNRWKFILQRDGWGGDFFFLLLFIFWGREVREVGGRCVSL